MFSGFYVPLENDYDNDISTLTTGVLCVRSWRYAALMDNSNSSISQQAQNRLWFFLKEFPGLERFVIQRTPDDGRGPSGAPSRTFRDPIFEPTTESLGTWVTKFCSEFERQMQGETEQPNNRSVKRLLYLRGSDEMFDDLLSGKSLEVSHEFNVV